MLKKLIALYLTPTPQALRQQQLQKLQLLLVDAELSLDQATANLNYIRAAIERLEAQCSPS
jgi:hypothetical protein